jgi:hypothetical protein
MPSTSVLVDFTRTCDGTVVAQLFPPLVLPGWSRTEATVYELGSPDYVPVLPGDVRLVDVSALEHVPDDLRSELESAGTDIAASFEDNLPVSFCYACWRTEKYWDVSIDTLAPYRRSGHAARCASWLIRHYFHHQKLRPVWGAEQGNIASERLAACLGFQPCGKLALYRPANE